ncbi:MAG: acyltransferase [Rhodoferax sp.]|nr:acyltransferase [Rhodoferax sp.]MDP3651345.1 acyltransferase [Rhodoferax sp.]
MLKLVGRIYQKIFRILFWITQKNIFKTLGRGAYFIRPFRIDGAANINIGEGTSFQRGAWLYCCGVNNQQATLSIGKGSVFGYNNHITSVGEVLIGSHVLTANNVYISDNIHGYEDILLPIIKQPVQFKRHVQIGTGAWIGENVCIIGASVGRNSVIGANAVVTSDIPDYSIAVGIPARVIKKYDAVLNIWVTVGND